MKKNVENMRSCLKPSPSAVVSCRDKDGKNNALVVGYASNVSFAPPMVMVGIVPTRYSYHIVKETGVFVVNIPAKSFAKEFKIIGTHSGRDMDKFAELNLKFTDGDKVNAPVLSDCPVNIECRVVSTFNPGGSHELFIGKVEALHCSEEYLTAEGNIDWKKIDLL